MTYYVSAEGEFWIQFGQETAASFMGGAPTQIGLGFEQNYSSSFAQSVTCPYWSDNA